MKESPESWLKCSASKAGLVSNFIPIEAEGEQFYIEVLPAGGQTGIKQRSRDGLAEKLTKDDFKQMIRQAVMPACQTFVDVWQELNQPLTAESAEVEFNLGFTATGSAVIVQASGQASFKVKVSWKFQQIKSQESQLSSVSNISSLANFNKMITPPNDEQVLLSSLLAQFENSVKEKYSDTPPQESTDKLKLIRNRIERIWNPPPPLPEILDIFSDLIPNTTTDESSQ